MYSCGLSHYRANRDWWSEECDICVYVENDSSYAFLNARNRKVCFLRVEGGPPHGTGDRIPGKCVDVEKILEQHVHLRFYSISFVPTHF